MALLRLVGLALGAYLLVVFGLGLAVRLLRLRTMARGVDRLTPAALRSFLDRVTGMAAAGAVAVAGITGTASPVAAAPAPPDGGTTVAAPPVTSYGPPVTLRGLAGPQPDPTPTTTTTVKPLPSVSPPPTLPPERQRITPRDLRNLPAEEAEPPAGTDTTGPEPPQEPPPTTATPPTDVVEAAPDSGPTPPPTERRRITSDRAAAGSPFAEAPIEEFEPGAGAAEEDTPAAPSGQPSAPSAHGPGTAIPATTEATWEVEVGDHFWSIAERTLADAWGRQPSASEVDPYWRELILRNRSRLVDPGNADLLLPGQVLVLAPVPVQPAA